MKHRTAKNIEEKSLRKTSHLTIMELVIRNYQWLKVTKYVEKYVDRYNIYQRMKNKIKVLVRKSIENEVLKKP